MKNLTILKPHSSSCLGKQGRREEGRGREGGRNGRGRRVLSVSIFAGECCIMHKAKYRGEVVAVKILKG